MWKLLLKYGDGPSVFRETVDMGNGKEVKCVMKYLIRKRWLRSHWKVNRYSIFYQRLPRYSQVVYR